MEGEAVCQVAEGEGEEGHLVDGGMLPALMGDRTILAAVVVFVGAREHRIFPVRAVARSM